MTDQLTIDEQQVRYRRISEVPDDLFGAAASTAETVAEERGGVAFPLAVPSEWLPAVLDRISEIARLPAGWDSHGGSPPRRDILTAGHAIAQSLAAAGDVPKPFINPTRSGGIQFEWEKGPRYFEIEIVSPMVAEYFYEDRDAGTVIEGTTSDGETLHTVIDLIRQVGTADLP